ncbi:hypothetical protein OU995_12005 [Roseateles sp. SL47]|uniref:hypothetical protein n=1 Tax=Roseateles sp. SL47 TaxID=2995138 RepID=UPI00226E5177|nr:hypothetical protein [Roseateles sp. SL47]WAC75373.1 hypothetical protein OU995_12005 [Roseateles sp. SL47]
MTTPSTTAIPSKLPQDLLFNAEKMDEVVNSDSQTYLDRFGISRLTVRGATDSMRALNPRGAWVGPGTNYQARDLVSSGGNWYLCLEAHTSGSTFSGDAARWRPFQQLDSDVTLVFGSNGASDDSAAVVAANALGRPICPIGILHIATPTTITVPLAHVAGQCFTITSQVTINNGQPTRPEWWGVGQGKFRLATIAAAPGTVVEVRGTVAPSDFAYGFSSGGRYIDKPLKIRGQKMPRLSDDARSLVDGSIIQGMVLGWSDGLEFENIGIDCGHTVVTTYYGGTSSSGVTEALNITYPDNATKTAAGSPSTVPKRGIVLDNVIGLCDSPGAPNHAILLEGVADVRMRGSVIGVMGTHGVALKGRDIVAEDIQAYLNSTDALIIKTDSQSTAVATRISIANTVLNASAPAGVTPWAANTPTAGLRFEAAGSSIDNIYIGKAKIDGFPSSVDTVFGGNYTIWDVEFGSISSDQYGVSGTTCALKLEAAAGRNIRKWTIGTLDGRNCSIVGKFSFSQPAAVNNHVAIGTVRAQSAQVGLDVGSQSYVTVGTVIADTLSDGIYRITGTPYLSVGQERKDEATPNVFASSGGGLVPSLNATWSQVADKAVFAAKLRGGRKTLAGTIKPSTSNVITTLPQFLWPSKNEEFICRGRSGSVTAAVPVTVSIAGVVTVNALAGGTANCSDELTLDMTWD